MSEHVLPQVAPSAMKPPKPKSHTALRVPASPPPLEPSSSSSSTVAADRSRLMVHPPSYVATLAATKAAQPSSSTGASACDGIHCATIEKLQMQIDTLTLEKSQMQVHMNLTSRSEATLSKQLAAVVEERNRLQQESMARADAIRVLDLEVRTAAVAKAMATRDLEVVLQRFSHLVDDVEVHGTHPALPAPPVGGHSNRSKEESERIAAFTSLNSKLQEAVNRSLQQSWEWGYRAGLTVGEESARRQRLQELEIIAWQQLRDDYVVSHNEAMMEASFDLVDADEGDLC